MLLKNFLSQGEKDAQLYTNYHFKAGTHEGAGKVDLAVLLI